jgi:hypothetical protein
MTRHDKIVKRLVSGKMPMPPCYTKSDVDLRKYALNFEQSALQYIREVEQGRVVCFIQGMPQRMTFMMCMQDAQFTDTNQFISSAAGIPMDESGELIAECCRVDAVSRVHNKVIKRLRKLGYLDKERAAELEQMTPETA